MSEDDPINYRKAAPIPMNHYNPIKIHSPLAELSQLIMPGVLGFYTHIECTELFANKPEHDGSFNVFTIVVAEERADTTQNIDCFLTPKLIRLKSLKGWSFGIRRYTRPINLLMAALIDLEGGKGWKLSGSKLDIGKLIPMPSQFVPPENGSPIQWNKLLKNNFWNGSHLFEWSDHKKELIAPFYEDPRRLQELSEQVEKYIPIQIAGMSDRLGNLVLQLPVSVVIATFQMLHDGSFQVEHVWHPKATPRPLTAFCELEHDDIVTGFSSARIEHRITKLPMYAGRGLYRCFIWDEQYNQLLMASGPSSFISTISFKMRSLDPEPRVFSVKNADGSISPRRISLIGLSNNSLIGNPHSDDNGGWTAKRMYKEQANKLAAERRFIQYRPDHKNDKKESRRKALDDLRALISTYGENGVWLWDPYLSALDIQETLFYCPYQGVDLRALTTTKGGKSEELRQTLTECESNWRGLSLEFRMQKGQAGWDFHDRFIIFPSGPDGAMAWSLGTSINSVGTAHHILQKVDNARLVMDAFIDLWDQLSKPEHLIWKHNK
ncbi:VPA1262 family N-terminal domain-containing protein [Aeromonas veronii]|uniref:VPA1262 family N-terminal domain-containing protein n=1 Tax=Aeromonas veronii TaxID=654 RepID=UPI000A9DED20|nr:VPA1262 family N-terminal domain-containing protein [Aeromonas veronii]MCX0426948.1 VPA1262 family N-terminal domain-containing protein [Aeromonas veronii]MCX0447787.1 VPA1262 family N-terminal domain-containing protein [Aeromonas veronii]